jgi:hypothetical protein
VFCLFVCSAGDCIQDLEHAKKKNYIIYQQTRKKESKQNQHLGSREGSWLVLTDSRSEKMESEINQEERQELNWFVLQKCLNGQELRGSDTSGNENESGRII